MKKRPCLDCGAVAQASRCRKCAARLDQLVQAKRKAWGVARSPVSPAKRHKVLDRDGWVCHLCGKRIASAADAHVDHVVPVAAGGSSDLNNLRAAHARCNLRRGARRIDHHK